MNSRNTFITLGIILAVLALGIAYAAVNNRTLNVAGNVATSTNDANFVIKFDSGVTPTTAGSGTTTAAITSDNTATMTVSGLTTENQTASATYTIKNASTATIGATLSAEVTNPKTDWFDVTYSFAKNSITKGESTTVTVTVKLKKTPVTTSDTDAAKGTFTVKVTATPQSNG